MTNKTYIADYKNKQLVERAPPKPEFKRMDMQRKHMADMERWNKECASLTNYPAPWITTDMHGKEFTEGVDFTLWYPNKVGEPGCVALRMEAATATKEGEKKAGARYKIDYKVCNSCGGQVEDNEYETVCVTQDGYRYYFCSKCSSENKHFNPIK